MTATQIRARGVSAPLVLEAMEEVPRHEFVREEDRADAYGDHPIAIGSGQTISQPYIVAYMTEKLELQPGRRVLEVGTGCGYQTAVLFHITPEVYSIEVIPELFRAARVRLGGRGFPEDHLLLGDGSKGWAEKAPFDAIVVTAAADRIPDALVSQLAAGGRMMVPVGPRLGHQRLMLVEKEEDGSVRFTEDLAVRFVPLTGD